MVLGVQSQQERKPKCTHTFQTASCIMFCDAPLAKANPSEESIVYIHLLLGRLARSHYKGVNERTREEGKVQGIVRTHDGAQVHSGSGEVFSVTVLSG